MKKKLLLLKIVVFVVVIGVGLITFIGVQIWKGIEFMESLEEMAKRKGYQGIIEVANKIEEDGGIQLIIELAKIYDKTFQDLNDIPYYLDGAPYAIKMLSYAEIGATDKAIANAIMWIDKATIDMCKNVPIVPIELFPIFRKHLSYALAQVNNMVSKNGDSEKWKLLRAQIYQWGYDYVNAIKEYNSLENELDMNHLYIRSRCYEAIGDTHNAIQDLTKMIETEEVELLDCLPDRAKIYQRIGLYEKAIDDYTRLIEYFSTPDGDVYCERGRCYELAGNEQKAMEDYNTAIEKNFPRGFMMRGELYKKQGKKELANADFKQAFQLDTIADVGSYRHNILLCLGKEEEAIAWMDEIIANNPENEYWDNKQLYYDKARLLAQMGRADDAIVALRTCIEGGILAYIHRAQRDCDMDAIRELPAYHSLIEEYEAKKKALWAE